MKQLFIALTALALTLTSMAQVTKTIDVFVAGTLSSLLSATEKSTITDLTVTGNIDARDFKCLRDDIVNLANVDLSLSNILEYNGTEGTNTRTIVYPANELPYCAFSYLEKWDGKRTLNNVKFPVSMTSIGGYAFCNCWGLYSIIIPLTVTSIRESAFYNTSISKITIPASVTSIGLCAFAIRDMIIVDSANQYYSSADGVLFNKAKTELLQYPYLKMGDYVIPGTVNSVGNNSFAFCGQLTSITIPPSVNKICFNAFQHCSSLTSITIPATVNTIENRGFGRFVGNINVDSANPFYSSNNGVLFNKAKTNLIQCPISKSGNYTIPLTVNSIEDVAFDACVDLLSITIPATVTEIGNSAFHFCIGLVSIYANAPIPINLSSKYSVFYYVNKTTCRLIVPKGSLAAYKAAPQWNEFTQIVEANSINVQIGANGSVTENSKNVSNGGSVMAIDNQSSTFTITPSPGYEVASLTYNGANVISQLVNNTFTTPAVVADGTLSVTFKRSIYKISVKLGGKGTMNLSYYYGDTPMFDFTPSSGAKIQSVFFNGLDVTANLVDNIYTMDPITTNGLLEVVFVSTATSTDNASDRIISITKSNNTIHIQGTRANEKIALYSTNGSLISTTVSESESVNIPVATNGLYLLRINGKTYKIAL